MKQLLLVTLIALFPSSASLGQFQKTYGSPNGDDMAYAGIETHDGGFAITGYTETLGASDDILVMKLNISGDLEWARAFGGNGYEEGKAILQTPDSGFVIGGMGDSYGSGDVDFYLIKTDPDGNLEWFKSFGGPSSEYFEDMTLAVDGGYVLIGTSLGFYNYGPWDIFLVKTDEEGELQWSKQIDLTGTIALGAEEGFAIDVTSDSGYILSTEPEHLGNGGSSGGDICLIKINSTGDVQWYSMGINNVDSPTDWDFGYSIHETSDHGFIVGGTTNTFSNGTKVALHKMDSVGSRQWSRFYNFEGKDFAYSCVPLSWGGFAIAGGYHAFSDSGDISLILTDDLGNPSFIEGYGGDGDDFASHICETSDEAFLIAGRSSSFSSGGDYDVYILKTEYHGTMKDCPKRPFHLIADDTMATEENAPFLEIDDPEPFVGEEIMNNSAVGVMVNLICPMATEITEPLVEKKIEIPSLLQQEYPLQLHSSYSYRVFSTDGRLLLEGEGEEIKFNSSGFFLVMISDQLFKVVVVSK